MRKIIGTAGFVAIMFTAFPASAHSTAPYDYAYCLQGKNYGLPGLCQFTSYQQCMTTASGTTAFCAKNPRLAFRTDGFQPHGLNHHDKNYRSHVPAR
ncbi:DUF3551 domain-containing protein [Bradyrhizobium roseum]|uniref:DUF3551 domain-containing protein n=1 Tax=Bradyrhizobium roseum TaxID=3056648 RepID=UPI00261E47B7|nr:DUF3551 domain-containing protein [Bradyrhizobium roseus]WKA27045.1 DUF3551 domain-containing protein [Bradyrhizobium roseus]